MTYRFYRLLVLFVILFVFLQCTSVFAYKPTSDPPKLVWSIKVDNYTTLKPADVSKSYVAVSTEVTGPIVTRYGLLILNRSNGRTVWDFDTRSLTYTIVRDGSLYIQIPEINAKGSYIRAYEINSKRIFFAYSSSGIDRRMIVAGNKIIFTDVTGKLVAADSITGKVLWWISPDDIPVAYMFSGTKQLIPLAVSDKYVYSKPSNEQFIIRSDINTAKINKPVDVIPGDNTSYQMFRLEWSSKFNILFLSGGVIGAGVEFLSIGALNADLSQKWFRWNTGSYELTGDVIVAENYTRPYKRAGIVGLNPHTGKVAWTRSFASQTEEEIIGKLGSYAVVMRPMKEKGKIVSYNLIGIDPKNGLQRWYMNIPMFTNVKAFGDIMIIATPGRSRSDSTIRAYRP